MASPSHRKLGFLSPSAWQVISRLKETGLVPKSLLSADEDKQDGEG